MLDINAAWIAWIVLILIQNTMGMSALTLPASANCGNQAVLTCTSTACNLGYRFVKNDVTIYNHRGPVGGIDADKYSGVVISNSQVQLTITNIQLSDSGVYGCNCGFEMLSAYETMQYTCMATLTVSSLANCEDQVVLTCKSTDCNTAYKFIRDGVIIYNHIGPQNEADPERYSGTITNNSQVQLIINKIELSDAGIYRCNCLFNEYSAEETLQYQCPPSAPTIAANFSITPGHLILTVVPGFHGGHNQTLVVQISTGLTSWTNITSVDIELDIRPINIILDNLIVNTLHHVRVFAYNIDGRSYFSREVNFTSSSYDISSDVSSNFNPVTVAGAAIGGIGFLVVIGVGIFISRKYNCSVKFERKKRTSSKGKTMTESGNIYEQAVTDTDTTHVYSQIQIQLVDNFIEEERTTSTDLYERPAVSSAPEHVYTDLSTPSSEHHVSTQDRSRDKRLE